MTTATDEHDALSDDLRRLIAAFKDSPDQTIFGWENLCQRAGLTSAQTGRAIRKARRMERGRDGQLAVLPHGRHATEFKWTTDKTDIEKTRLRHLRISYAYALHVFWSEHQSWDRMVAQGAPQNEQFEMNYEMRKSREALASQEAKIVSLGRSLGLPDKRIASFFRVHEDQVSPNDPEAVHALV